MEGVSERLTQRGRNGRQEKASGYGFRRTKEKGIGNIQGFGGGGGEGE